jgi:hypothetical protein
MPDKDTKNEKNSKENEFQETETIPEIELSDFRQYVKYDIPYNGIVKDVGKIKYDEDRVFVIVPSETEEPTRIVISPQAVNLNGIPHENFWKKGW